MSIIATTPSQLSSSSSEGCVPHEVSLDDSALALFKTPSKVGRLSADSALHFASSVRVSLGCLKEWTKLWNKRWVERLYQDSKSPVPAVSTSHDLNIVLKFSHDVFLFQGRTDKLGNVGSRGSMSLSKGRNKME